MPEPSGTVTFLFADVEGSTRLLQEHPTAVGAALGRYQAMLRETVTAQGGKVFETLGDGVYAAFPEARPAVNAALAAQRALRSEAWGEVGPVKARMALHTGEVERWGDHYFGPPLFRVARLLAIGHGGQVLLSQATANLVRDALPGGSVLRAHGSHRLKDLAQPERVFELVPGDVPAEFPPLKSLNVLPNNLPLQLTQFIGREREITELIDLMRAQRLVTLTGSGGAGKTRLALQLAADVLDDFEDGVWLVEFASLSDASLVPRQVAATLNVREDPGRSLVATLVDSIRARHLLLVLDNCEHLVGACADLVEALLQSCPLVRVLATSREALGLSGERPWRVPSLRVPAVSQLSSDEQLTKYEGVRLFIDRASAVFPTFAPTDDQARAVAQVCSRLDGIPLAIELAAARVNVLTIEQIAERLDDRFRLLTAGSRTAPPRQQTLRAAVDWSYELLGSSERLLFRWLAVFAGGFELRAAEDVCGEVLNAQVLDPLGLLVNKSLVNVDAAPSGSIRYRLHETLREYALEKLQDAGEDAAARDRHLAHFLSLAEDAYGRRVYLPAEWLARLELDHDNLRAALQWSSERYSDKELPLAGALAWFWDGHSHRTEGLQRLFGVLANATGTSPARARALWGASALASWAGATAILAHPNQTAVRLGEESLAMWRELGDREEVALALWNLGWSHFVGGDDKGALPLWEESLSIAEMLGNPWLINRARLGVCQVLCARGDVAAAAPIAETGLKVGLELGDPWAVHFAHHFLGDCALIRGDFVTSERKYADSLRAGMETGAHDIASGQMQGIAMAVAGQGRFVKALRLDEAAEAAFKEFGVDPSGIRFWQALRTRFIGASAEAIGDAAALAARAEGRAMGFRAAAEYALDLGRD